MKTIRLFAILWMLVACSTVLGAGEVIPPRPAKYFNDYAHVVSPDFAADMNQQLAAYERDTSNQFVVAIYPKMQSDSSVDDYSVRVAQSWGVGQKGKNNGLVLFVFVEDHKVFIPTGYGLEGAIPDATAKEIIDTKITPQFKQGNWEGGLRDGLTTLMAAGKGEYQGTGQTAQEKIANKAQDHGAMIGFAAIVVILLLGALLGRHASNSSGTTYSGSGHTASNVGWFALGMLFNIATSALGGGGGGGGGDGGFSGGGGSFGGGGTGGSW